MVPSPTENYGKAFPLMVDGSCENFVTFQEGLQRENYLEKAREHGAVLFRGVEMVSAEEWAAVLSKVGLEATPYVGGAAVRKLVVGSEDRLVAPQVVTTNESPPSEPIPPHHELAQTPSPPTHICFYCLENTKGQGGATSICRSDVLYDLLQEKHPGFVHDLTTRGVKYIKIAPDIDDPSSALGRSWRSAYDVKTKADAENAMKDRGYTWEWLEGNDCKMISPKLDAVKTGSNGRQVLLNQIIAAYTGWIDKRNDPSKAVVFADDMSPLPAQPMADLITLFQENQVSTPWENGDFLLVDNTIACHARQPYSLDNGRKRKVLAAIANHVEGETTTTKEEKTTHLALPSGDLLPGVGLGCWKLEKADCATVVYEAIKAGYRLIDSAADYGNEIETGKGIKRALDEGICQREDLFIVSKLWNTFHAHVEEGIQKSLTDLQINYLDLYLIHFPIAQKYVPITTRYPPEWIYDPTHTEPKMEFDMDVTYQQTYEAMEALVGKKLTRNIGCCNIGTAMLRQVLTFATIKPAVLQIELHPHNTQSKLLRYAREFGVQVMAFSNLASASYVELDMAKPEDSLLLSPVIKEIAGIYKKSPAQILLRWGVQRGTAVIPKTTKVARLRENINLFDFCLSPDDMRRIDGLNQNKRYNDPGHFCELAFNTFSPIYE